MGTIASLNVALSMGSAAFNAGLKKARTDLSGFANSIKGSAAAVAIGLDAGAVIGFIKHSMDSIDTLKDQATAIGVTTEALSRLSYAAGFSGVSTEEMTSSLGKMLKNLDEVASTGKGAAAGAIETLGLNAEKLVNMSPDAAFREIAGAMESIHNPAQRVGIAMDIFGKSGASLIPVLAEGKDGIMRMEKEADLLGKTISSTGAVKVEAAKDSMQKFWEMLEGVANTLSVQLAPFIQLVADKLVAFGISGGGVGPKVLSAFEMVVKGIAYASDYLSLIQAGFYALKGVATAAILGIILPITKLIEAVEWLGKKLGIISEPTTWGEFARGLEENLADQTHEAFKKAGEEMTNFTDGKNSKKVSQFFDDVRSKADAAAQATVDAAGKINTATKVLADNKNLEKITEMIDKLRVSVEQFGMTDAQKLADNLRKLGATDAQVDEGVQLQERLEKMKKNAEYEKKAGEDRQKLFEEMRTPVEKYMDQIEKLDQMVLEGLDSETYDRAVAKAEKELADSGKGKGGIKSVAAVERRHSFTNLGMPDIADPMKENVRVANRQLEEQKKMRTALETLAAENNETVTI